MGIHEEHPWARIQSLDYPVKLDKLSAVLESIRTRRVKDLSKAAARNQIIGHSADMQAIRKLVSQVAPSTATVLITGESGTGKEVIAREIHAQSGRPGPFVAVNCGAIPDQLLESELFGHERGAFTGAASARAGRFELAKGGTFFLDEIGDMPAQMQVKLLRVLEERVVERVGSTKSIPVDVRIVAATHRDLPSRIATGKFREDLFYRLSVFPIDVSPLRDRVDDIAPLCDEFTRRLSHQHDIDIRIAPSAMERLCVHAWPGNVRELANLVERLGVIKPSGVIEAADLPWPFAEEKPARDAPNIVSANLTRGLMGGGVELPEEGLDLKAFLSTVERDMIEDALEEAGGVVQSAAEKLGIGRTTLVEKIKRYQIRK